MMPPVIRPEQDQYLLLSSNPDDRVVAKRLSFRPWHHISAYLILVLCNLSGPVIKSDLSGGFSGSSPLLNQSDGYDDVTILSHDRVTIQGIIYAFRIKRIK